MSSHSTPRPSSPSELLPVEARLALLSLEPVITSLPPTSTAPSAVESPGFASRRLASFFHKPPEFSTPAQGFQGGSLTPPPPPPSRPPALTGGPSPVDPCDVPLGVKPVGKRTLSGNAELSVFDILNTFRRRWFLSIDNLRAQALSAQKAEDGKIFWVEFTPQFHAHLVKCAVALVPHPIQKVKRVMFVYILELLNGQGHQAFFDLTKGTRIATQAQKQKKQLARKRSRAARRERRKAAAEGTPQRQCRSCGRKFASRKAAKRHRCPVSKEASKKVGTVLDKGKAKSAPKPNKPAPTPSPLAPSAPFFTPSPAEAALVADRLPPPTSAREAAAARTLPSTLRGEEHGAIFAPTQPSGSRRSKRLNTVEKRNVRKGILETVREKSQLG
jgi:predicted Zn-ribbon and HTH transcriptional regulator